MSKSDKGITKTFFIKVDRSAFVPVLVYLNFKRSTSTIHNLHIQMIVEPAKLSSNPPFIWCNGKSAFKIKGTFCKSTCLIRFVFFCFTEVWDTSTYCCNENGCNESTVASISKFLLVVSTLVLSAKLLLNKV